MVVLNFLAKFQSKLELFLSAGDRVRLKLPMTSHATSSVGIEELSSVRKDSMLR